MNLPGHPEPITVPLTNFTIKGVSGGTSPLNFTHEMILEPAGESKLFDCDYLKIEPTTWIDGTIECTAPTYTISGYANTTGEPGGVPAKTVNITNLNESKDVEDRPADYIDPVTGFYNLTLNVPSEVEAEDELLIVACDVPSDNESNCNHTIHMVENAPGEDTNVNLTLNHFCRNPVTYPYRTWNASNWSGPAAMEMMIDHYRDPPNVPNQTVLNETGIGYNQACNSDLEFVDARGMKYTLNKYLHAYNGLPYVANYGIGSYTDINDTLHYMCKWHYLGPGVAPAYGNYSNWMVVRGIHTDVKPTFTQGSYKIYGFWMNDPYNATMEGPGGIGENTYKSVEQWKSMYHLMLNVNEDDDYNGTYVAVCEPPEDDDVEVTLAKPKPRLAEPITPELMAKPMMVYGAEQLAIERAVKDDESLKIVKAAIDGVTEELIPYDSEFAAVFAKTVPGKPKLVTSDNGDYYVVPFNVPVKERPPVKIMPVEIERPKVSGLEKFERMKRVADRIELKPLPVEPVKVEKTLVVVLVDAEDGSFKEASWVKEPVKYLPVSKIEAMKLALGEVLDELHVVARKDARDLEVIQQRPTIELVYMDASPYYPNWKVTVNGKVFYVSQDGTVSCDEPEEPPVYSSYLAFEADEYNGWGVETLDPTGMVAQMLEYVEACAPIGPVCLPVEIAEEIVDTDPCEAFYITDEPEGVIVPCPS